MLMVIASTIGAIASIIYMWSYINEIRVKRYGGMTRYYASFIVIMSLLVQAWINKETGKDYTLTFFIACIWAINFYSIYRTIRD